MILDIKIFNSSAEFAEAVANIVEVPKSLLVLKVNQGLLNEGTDKERSWANAQCVDTALYDQFTSIGQGQYCPTIKVKLSNYDGRDIQYLEGQEIKFNTFNVSFESNRFNQPIGLSLVLDLSDIKAV